MRIVVIGGTGLIGAKVVSQLAELGHDVVPASPTTGVDTITGEGLVGALAGASVVVDVSNAPAFGDAEVLDFFTASTRNLLTAEFSAGVGHHVALSVVGADRRPARAYFLAKLAQERLIAASDVPYSIIRATQFFEFIARIADAATTGSTVRVAPVRVQPMAADDVAAAVRHAATSAPVDGIVEIAGPEQFRLDDLIHRSLAAHDDPREVLADPNAPYFGAVLDERTLVPGVHARLGDTRYRDWLDGPSS